MPTGIGAANALKEDGKRAFYGLVIEEKNSLLIAWGHAQIDDEAGLKKLRRIARSMHGTIDMIGPVHLP